MLVSYSVTLSIIAFALLFPRHFELISPTLTLICVLVFGIPHGALYHIMHYHLCQKSFNSSVLPHKSSHLRRSTRLSATNKPTDSNGFAYQAVFYASYLIIMLAWAIGWVVSPFMTLTLFLIVSAYHFGEVHIRIEFNRFLKLTKNSFFLLV